HSTVSTNQFDIKLLVAALNPATSFLLAVDGFAYIRYGPFVFAGTGPALPVGHVANCTVHLLAPAASRSGTKYRAANGAGHPRLAIRTHESREDSTKAGVSVHRPARFESIMAASALVPGV